VQYSSCVAPVITDEQVRRGAASPSPHVQPRKHMESSMDKAKFDLQSRFRGGVQVPALLAAGKEQAWSTGAVSKGIRVDTSNGAAIQGRSFSGWKRLKERHIEHVLITPHHKQSSRQFWWDGTWRLAALVWTQLSVLTTFDLELPMHA
jgi:hypothetical protein